MLIQQARKQFDGVLRTAMATVHPFATVTVERESKGRWTVMGEHGEWVVFEVISSTSFRISAPLRGELRLRCALDHTRMAKSIADGIRELAETMNNK